MEQNTCQIKVEKAHCMLCFQTLYSYLNKLQPSISPTFLQDEKCPLFVTWRIGQSKDLRGCIGKITIFNIIIQQGTFDDQQLLSKLLIKYALQSAMNDSRFSPITMKEFSSLHVGVSFLVNFQYPETIWDWEVGKHGINIEFEYPDQTKIRYYSGTFLPEVAKEQNWSKEETMEALIKKVGFYQDKWEKVLPKLKLQRYESSKLEMSYEEFVMENQVQQQQK